MAEPRTAAAGRYLAIDHGRRRIGVAVGDSETGLAFARPAIRTRSAAAAVEAVAGLARAEGAICVIIGLPLHEDGSEGAQAAQARSFGSSLAERGFEVVFHDERLTTWQAAGELASERRQPDRRSGELDSRAARLILQDYLDSKEDR